MSLNVKLKNNESKFLSIMTVKWEEKVLKCDKNELRLLRQVPLINRKWLVAGDKVYPDLNFSELRDIYNN